FRPILRRRDTILFPEDWLDALVFKITGNLDVVVHDGGNGCLCLFLIGKAWIGLTPDSWPPLVGWNLRTGGDACQEAIEVRQLHASRRGIIGHEKVIELIKAHGLGERRLVRCHFRSSSRSKTFKTGIPL